MGLCLTGNNVAADDLATQSGQRLGHHGDDAATRGLDISGTTTGGWYPGTDGADGGSCVGGLSGCWQEKPSILSQICAEAWLNYLKACYIVGEPPPLLTCRLRNQLGGHDGSVAADNHDRWRTAAGQSHWGGFGQDFTGLNLLRYNLHACGRRKVNDLWGNNDHSIITAVRSWIFG